MSLVRVRVSWERILPFLPRFSVYILHFMSCAYRGAWAVHNPGREQGGEAHQSGHCHSSRFPPLGSIFTLYSV